MRQLARGDPDGTLVASVYWPAKSPDAEKVPWIIVAPAGVVVNTPPEVAPASPNDRLTAPPLVVLEPQAAAKTMKDESHTERMDVRRAGSIAHSPPRSPDERLPKVDSGHGEDVVLPEVAVPIVRTAVARPVEPERGGRRSLRHVELERQARA